MVEITTATEGCGYINVSWTVIGNNDVCPIHFFATTLSFVTMGNYETVYKETQVKSISFNELPNDTQVNVTVTGISNTEVILSLDSTSVRTKVFKSMCMQIYILLITLHYLYKEQNCMHIFNL